MIFLQWKRNEKFAFSACKHSENIEKNPWKFNESRKMKSHFCTHIINVSVVYGAAAFYHSIWILHYTHRICIYRFLEFVYFPYGFLSEISYCQILRKFSNISDMQTDEDPYVWTYVSSTWAWRRTCHHIHRRRSFWICWWNPGRN